MSDENNSGITGRSHYSMILAHHSIFQDTFLVLTKQHISGYNGKNYDFVAYKRFRESSFCKVQFYYLYTSKFNI